ncbi:MAG: RNA polymerase sigma-70 factor [Bacteroidota bacterium]
MSAFCKNNNRSKSITPDTQIHKEAEQIKDDPVDYIDNLHDKKDPPLRRSKDLENLYQRNYRKLFHISYNLIKDREVAKGIVHDAFTDIWSKRDTFRADICLDSYVTQVVKFLSIDFLRAKAVRDNAHQELMATSPSEHNHTEEQIVLDNLQSEVNRLVSQLPSRRQQVFRMKREKFMSNKAIAVGLNISEKAVEKHMTKALRYLREATKGTFLFFFFMG